MTGYILVDKRYNHLTDRGTFEADEEGCLYFVRCREAKALMQYYPGAYKALAVDCRKSDLSRGAQWWKALTEGQTVI